jgi:hypothetical protein
MDVVVRIIGINDLATECASVNAGRIHNLAHD